MKATYEDLIGLVDYIREASDATHEDPEVGWWIRCADWIESEAEKLKQ